MHASQTVSRLAAIGLAVILLFLSGFALWGATTTDHSANEVKRAEVVSDGFRLARYALALEDLVMTTYLTLPVYQTHHEVAPRTPVVVTRMDMQMAGATGMSMGTTAPLGTTRAQSMTGYRSMSGSRRQPDTDSDGAASVPSLSAQPPFMSGHSSATMPGTRVGPGPMSTMGGTAAGSAAPGTTPSATYAGSQALGGILGGSLPTGAKLRAAHADAAGQLAAAMQTVMLNGSAADRALANDVLRRHAVHMAYAMAMFAAVDHHQTGLALWIQQHELGPSFSYIEREVNHAAQSRRIAALRSLQHLSSTESLVFAGTIIAFTVGLILLAALAALLRSYAGRIDETRKVELERLARVALTDNLTGLRNHRAFQEDLVRQLEYRNRTGIEFCLLLLDLNGLKQINDTFGHQKGDEQLIELGACLGRVVRKQDMAYRIGGDEFAILLTDGTAWGGVRLMDRLNLELMASAVFPQPSVAAGVAESTGAPSKDLVIQKADTALIQSKRTDKSCMVYSEGMPRELRAPAEEFQQSHLATLTTALARAVDAKDSYTRSHSETVSELCALIASELELAPDRCSSIRLAGLLHDVGKIGIADAILKKASKLTPAETEVMKTHSTLGYTIVMGAALEQEAHWILHHHERLDGKGYPDGLKGDEIPLESRIILTADAFEAMTSDRPYRKGRPDFEALEELDRCAGTQFDPACVAALKRALLPQRGPEPECEPEPLPLQPELSLAA